MNRPNLHWSLNPELERQAPVDGWVNCPNPDWRWKMPPFVRSSIVHCLLAGGDCMLPWR